MTKAELITAFIAAKEAEADAKATRAALGTELAELLGHPTEGQKTHKIDDYKVSIKGSMNRKVDWEAFDAIELPAAAPVKVERKIDLKGLEWYAQNHPKEHDAIIRTITSTPGAVQVTVKEGSK